MVMIENAQVGRAGVIFGLDLTNDKRKIHNLQIGSHEYLLWSIWSLRSTPWTSNKSKASWVEIHSNMHKIQPAHSELRWRYSLNFLWITKYFRLIYFQLTNLIVKDQIISITRCLLYKAILTLLLIWPRSKWCYLCDWSDWNQVLSIINNLREI